MARIQLLLDGKSIEVEAGSTILEAARSYGIEIPTLCHDPRLKPSAACRMCMVDVEGARGPMPACSTPAVPGMIVRTATEEIIKTRRTALELLVSDHYGDCIAPCQRACPAGIDIQGYIGLIANGQYDEALKLIKESNPLPLVCGRVCPRFCETKCRRNIVDEPVAINALKRFAADYALADQDAAIPRIKPATGHKVAIVGGGPAGLSVAYYLALEGHEITIFEGNPELGGMLRYGIPEYRLPKAILAKETAAISRLCHKIYYNTFFGRDFDIADLKAKGYEAIFLALGAQGSQRMGVEGEDMPGVLSGIGFLKNTALGMKTELGREVVVIGGGNTAIDAARTALRLGAAEVTIAYRRSRDEMPARDEEVEQAEEEGVQFQFLAAPVRLHSRNGRTSAIECVRMALGEPDSSGRRRPRPIDGSEFTVAVDTAIAAIGQTIDACGLGQDGRMELNSKGYIQVNEKTMATNLTGVFAGGDCTLGPATVVEAIAAGHRAATSIHRYLSGQPVEPVKKVYNCTRGELDEIDVTDYRGVERVPRTEMPVLDPEMRRSGFAEIETGFTEVMAKAEAKRCLACGCQDVFECKLRQLGTEYEVDDAKYSGRKHHFRIKENEHPFILRDPNKCVLCGRCVRICDEVQGVSALGFTNRGFATIIEPALGMPLSETPCDSCGQCVSTCPTGALTNKVHLPKPGPWRLEVVPTICPYCGVGCNLELNIIGNRIVRVTSPIGCPVNGGNLCRKGTFNPGSLNSMKRVKVPLIRQGDHLVETTWDEALDLAGKELRRIREQGGRDGLAVLSSPYLTNEESYLAQKLARMALATNNIGGLATAANENLLKSFGANISTCSYDEILSSDLIIVFGCDVSEDYPVIALKIREAVARGSKLVLLGSRPTRLDSLAAIILKVNQRTSTEMLGAMLNYILSYELIDRNFIVSQTTGFPKLAKEMERRRLDEIKATWVKPARIVEAIHLYVRARRPVIVLNADTVAPAEIDLISDLALATGNVGRRGAGIIALRSAGNAQGLIDMGVSPDYLPGQQPITDTSARRSFEIAWGKPIPVAKGRDFAGIIQGVEKGEIKGIIALDVSDSKIGNLIAQAPVFSVLISTVLPESPPYPSVVLPGANFAESEGTYTNCEGRVQQLRRAITPPGGKQNWEVIAALASALGYPMSYASASSIYEEIAKLVRAYRGKSAGSTEPVLWLRSGFKNRPARFRLPESNGSGGSEDRSYSLANSLQQTGI